MALLSQTSEYALRAAVCLACHPGTALTTQVIATHTQVPPSYLSKVLRSLGRAGLVRSQRGLRGGFSLAREPGEITALEVINAVDPLQRIEHCPLNLPQHKERLCPMHRRLDAAIAELERSFASTTLTELLEGDGTLRPMGLPKVAP